MLLYYSPCFHPSVVQIPKLAITELAVISLKPAVEPDDPGPFFVFFFFLLPSMLKIHPPKIARRQLEGHAEFCFQG